jgi:hypothetical protein
MPLFSPSDLNRARQRVERYVWAAEIFSFIRTCADSWVAHPALVPTLAGGWVHDYVCPEHWCALTFAQASPNAHRCSFGETRVGEILDAAWRVLEHRRIASAARDLALAYTITNDGTYADAARDILMQYAHNYSHYAGGSDARGWMLKGRVFNQALTEAIWAIPIAHAYDLIRAMLSPAQDALIANDLLRPIAATLTRAQQGELVHNPKSNYNAWLIATLGVLGYALGDDALIERSLDSPAGFHAHLSAAILPDGFEYEGTPYYHNFVALAYTLLAEAARANGRDLYAERGPAGQSIEAMWSALASLAFADGSIPQINDGAYHSSGSFASEICETYEIAFARTNKPEFAWLLNQNYAHRPRDVWSALLFAEHDITNTVMPPRESVCLQYIGIAVVRDDANAQEICVPFGPYAGSHSHLDRLGIQIFPWSTDPGTPLYGVEARAAWFQQTAAHNVVVVDGKAQAPCAGQLLNWIVSPDSTWLWLAADAAYPDVRFSRLLKLSKGVFTDSVLLDSESEHTYDCLIHLDGVCQFDGVTMSDTEDRLGNDGAYRFITFSARRNFVTGFQFTLRHADKMFQINLNSNVPFEIFFARSPARADAPSQPRQTIVARAQQRRANFLLTSEWL